MFNNLKRLLEIAINRTSNVYEQCENYRKILNKLNNNEIIDENDLEELVALYELDYKKESLTRQDMENISKEIAQLEERI